MFKKILNKLKAEKINGSAKLLVNSSKNLMDALEFVHAKKERPKERNLNLSLEQSRSYTKYAKQKELMDKLIEVEMLSLSSYITDYIKDGVSDKLGKGIEDLGLLLHSAIVSNVIPKELEDNLTLIITTYVRAIENQKFGVPENLEAWLGCYIDTAMGLVKHIREKILPELTDVSKMALF